MSNKKKNIKQTKKPSASLDLETKIKAIIQNIVIPIDQRLSVLNNKIENVKSNTIVAVTLLERKKVFSREEFLKEFNDYHQSEVAVVDGDGNMNGYPVFSIYNMETNHDNS